MSASIARSRPKFSNANSFRDLDACQNAFDGWRQIYNHERPHEALDYATPGTRYHVSPRAFREELQAIEYAPGDFVRKVDHKGFISFKGRPWRISRAFGGQPVALRPTAEDGVFNVNFCLQHIGIIDLRTDKTSARGLVDIATAMSTTPAGSTPNPRRKCSIIHHRKVSSMSPNIHLRSPRSKHLWERGKKKLRRFTLQKTRQLADIAASVAHEEAAQRADAVHDAHAHIARDAQWRDIVGEQPVERIG